MALAAGGVTTTGGGNTKITGTAAATSAKEPDYVVVDEDWWVPLRMDAVDSVANARYFYRRDNERAAADEVRKAASWLDYAADHALPETRQSLLSSRTDLLTLADDLDTGKLAGGARLDTALAEASGQLARWHYYRAKEEFGRNDAANAALDLQAAAGHLENAATSAHLQYGPDTVSVFEDIYRDGTMSSRGKTIDNDLLGKHLDVIANAIEIVAHALS
jgi:hypothetical protein